MKLNETNLESGEIFFFVLLFERVSIPILKMKVSQMKQLEIN